MNMKKKEPEISMILREIWKLKYQAGLTLFERDVRFK